MFALKALWPHTVSFLGLRSTIRNARSIHTKSSIKRLTQDTYRRNSRRYLQQKGGRLAEPHGNSRNAAKSPLRERKNEGKENMFILTATSGWFVTSEPPHFVILNKQTTFPSCLDPVRRARWRKRLRSSLPGRVQSSSWSAAPTTPARKSASTGHPPAPKAASVGTQSQWSQILDFLTSLHSRYHHLTNVLLIFKIKFKTANRQFMWDWVKWWL